MAQAKKKQSTRTAKKGGTKCQAHKKSCTKTSKRQQSISNSDKMHIYVITAMTIIAGVLLCANLAMLTV